MLHRFDASRQRAVDHWIHVGAEAESKGRVAITKRSIGQIDLREHQDQGEKKQFEKEKDP